MSNTIVLKCCPTLNIYIYHNITVCYFLRCILEWRGGRKIDRTHSSLILIKHRCRNTITGQHKYGATFLVAEDCRREQWAAWCSRIQHIFYAIRKLPTWYDYCKHIMKIHHIIFNTQKKIISTLDKTFYKELNKLLSLGFQMPELS